MKARFARSARRDTLALPRAVDRALFHRPPLHLSTEIGVSKGERRRHGGTSGPSDPKNVKERRDFLKGTLAAGVVAGASGLREALADDAQRGTECTLCGACADVCPEECITFEPVSAIEANPVLRDAAIEEHGEAAAALFEGPDASGISLIKDETICIRCGLCAAHCPAGTITMEQFFLEERSDGRA